MTRGRRSLSPAASLRHYSDDRTPGRTWPRVGVHCDTWRRSAQIAIRTPRRTSHWQGFRARSVDTSSKISPTERVERCSCRFIQRSHREGTRISGSNAAVRRLLNRNGSMQPTAGLGHVYASERSALDGAISPEGCQSRNRARTTSGAHPLCSVSCSVDVRGKGAISGLARTATNDVWAATIIRSPRRRAREAGSSYA